MTERVRTTFHRHRGEMRFGAACDLCGTSAGGEWTTAGMAAGWASAHVGLERYADVPLCRVPR